MKNTNIFLPSLKEDISCFYDGPSFFNPDEYTKFLKILKPYEYRNIGQSRIKLIDKKSILSYILEKENLEDDKVNQEFLEKLKKCLPEGLCYENICTDSEYEALRKEFNITGA